MSETFQMLTEQSEKNTRSPLNNIVSPLYHCLDSCFLITILLVLMQMKEVMGHLVLSFKQKVSLPFWTHEKDLLSNAILGKIFFRLKKGVFRRRKNQTIHDLNLNGGRYHAGGGGCMTGVAETENAMQMLNTVTKNWLTFSWENSILFDQTNIRGYRWKDNSFKKDRPGLLLGRKCEPI